MHNEHWLTSTAFSLFGAPWTNEVTKGICIQVQRCSKPTHDHVATSLGRGLRCVAHPISSKVQKFIDTAQCEHEYTNTQLISVKLAKITQNTEMELL